MAPDREAPEVLWRPDPGRVAQSEMRHFIDFVSRKSGVRFGDYDSVHSWSIEDPSKFWTLFLEFTKVPTSGSSEPALTGKRIEETRWFPDLRLNFAEVILGQDRSGPAILSFSEADPEPAVISFPELKCLVAGCAASLKKAGVQSGDCVAGFLTNGPEAVIAALACAALGVTWCSTSPDFGLAALADRLEQVKPKLLFAVDGYRYGGRQFDTGEVISRIRDLVPSIECLVTVPIRKGEAKSAGDISWEEFGRFDHGRDLEFPHRSFNHPLYVLFSSGTTGKPKCLLHGAGGTLLQHLKELRLHCDVGPSSRLLFFTTCGWMMWNWQLSALATGAAICLYDGSPSFPTVDAIWNHAQRLSITHFGTSGRYLETCMKADPAIRFGRSGFQSLQTVLYTGSPLSAEGFRWVYREVKADLHLAGISGGTDIISCFVLGNPLLPVRAGEIQCKGLGVDVVALDEEGKPVWDQPGELVCRQAIPSMPLGFLNDPDGSKYREAYFEHYRGLWRHGDWVEFRRRAGIVIYGRSDATLNPGGVRIGSAEIYAALDGLAWVQGAVVVGWKPPGGSDEIVVLAVTLSDRRKLSEGGVDEIRRQVRQVCSPRHVPREIFEVSAVPVTRSGKPVELAVKAVLAGKKVSSPESLANPEVLEEFGEIRSQLLQKYASRG